MNDEPELYVVDFPQTPGAAEYRERRERARQEARLRYRAHLAAAFDLAGAAGNPDDLAEIALDALTNWSDVESGEPCPCSCHPHLPASDFHDFGFGCNCTKTREDRRRGMQEWLDRVDRFWESPAGERLKTARAADEAELEAWVAAQPGVTIRSHGGLAPEQWRGEVTATRSTSASATTSGASS